MEKRVNRLVTYKLRDLVIIEDLGLGLFER